ncbi:(2E,6E)-farnesyl diphosphate synthase [Cellvibrio mixtus]|uniref:(2E,6E)-farnesyl diphosphate synthase n=1 Tax=Cellvibrio mixtus TaxID=39650 RepID=A0A266QDR4_9GAMM|nr:farnesyl diphosphate synthase [Cellvibrio mixtus]OZY87786.1 (2E,6E)-farnesyl diphosphate synthase [Cellvibrio mixtus]
MSQDFSTFASDCRHRVDSALDHHLPLGSDPTQLRAAMRYSLFNGGKRVRPILAYASALAINPLVDLALIDPVACALECLHSYSLVHDDLPAMDDDDLRRGKPTCHIAFNEASAILAGDGLQTLAFDLLTQTDLPASTQIQLVRQLASGSGAEGMVLGQAIDLAAVDHQLDLTQLENMHRHKTGALIRAAVAMGATAAGATPIQLHALDSYAAAIGLAFQVQDDILDVTADTATLGKQQGADIARNKPTYVSLLGLDTARDKATELHQQAQAALRDFGESATHLRQLARYIVERSN